MLPLEFEFSMDQTARAIGVSRALYPESTFVKFTRSRSSRKDDNAHIQQKNWTMSAFGSDTNALTNFSS